MRVLFFVKIKVMDSTLTKKWMRHENVWLTEDLQEAPGDVDDAKVGQRD